MCIQFLIGPTLAFNGFDQYQYFVYRMQITESEYFSYALPAIICFILGLNINSQLRGEKLNIEAVTAFIHKRTKLPIIMIVIGFVTSFLAQFISSEIGFVFYLLAGFKFIGVFMIICSDSKIKITPMILVYVSIISSSLGEGMFHDLIMWILFLGLFYAIRYKPSVMFKLIFTIGFLVVVTVIQVLKSDYRTSIRSGEEAGLETLNKAYEEKENEKSGGIFSLESLGPAVTRINQGFIITNIMKTVPAKTPYEDGSEMAKILEAAILPRILAPDKLRAGDREIFMKYSGLRLREGTSMGLSSLGDAYINFGITGGCIFMFFLGLLYNFTLIQFHNFSRYFPLLLLFVPLVFYYPIRPDCELQTILGHFLKSIFLIFIVMKFWKKFFKIEEAKPFFAI